MKAAIIGKPKSGKTFLANQLVTRCLYEGHERALIWDTIREQQYDGIPLASTREAVLYRQHRRWVFRPPVTADEVARLALELQKHGAGPLVVVIDETRLPGVLSNFRFATEALARLAYGSRNVSLLLTTQVPSSVPADVRSLVEYYIFALSSKRDLESLTDLAIPDETIDMVRRLRPEAHQYVYCSPGG